MNIAWLDDYERRTRLIPGLLVLFPLVGIVGALGLHDHPFVTAGVGALAGIGGPVVMASYVREKGFDLEKILFNRWGGSPTTLRLRSIRSGNGADWNRLRSSIRLATSISLPTKEELAGTSDAPYEEAVAQLRARTRDTSKFPLIAVENRNYGFARNTLALRSAGLAVATVALLANGGLLISQLNGSTPLASATVEVLSVAISALWLVGWLKGPTEIWVRRSAERYADQLITAISLLVHDGPGN